MLPRGISQQMPMRTSALLMRTALRAFGCRASARMLHRPLPQERATSAITRGYAEKGLAGGADYAYG